jgi:hypothetical protein
MPRTQRFTLTEEHVKLLQRAYVDWEECEFGAPAIDCKRPYGSSSVLNDIHEILTGESIGSTHSKRDELTEEEEARYTTLHRETETALQIILRFKSFEPAAFQREYYWDEWERVGGEESIG